MRRLLSLSATAALSVAVQSAAAADDAAAVGRILAERCVLCHQGEAAPLGLRLDSIDALLAGGARGAVVKPGDPVGSELMRRLRGQSLPRMPLTGPPFLSDAETATVERWIAAGAPRPSSPATAAPPRKPRAPDEPPTYADVQPILGARCAKCHTESGQMGPAPEGLLLNNYANTLAAGERARIVPGRPAASELVRRIRGQSLPRMPFDGPPYLSDAEIRLIERWIEHGARDPEGKPAPVPVGARVRLGGTLVAPAQLDDLRFTQGGRVRARDAAVGGRAELRGTVAPDGSIVAERLRGR
jgi:mono/diheme cytochrome c family protein